jgi:hypothetical protein
MTYDTALNNLHRSCILKLNITLGGVLYNGENS